jgi:predicted metal-binding protein
MPESDKNRFQVEIKKFEDSDGLKLYYEQYKITMPISSIVHSKKNKQACETCINFNKNLACPPYSPYFLQYIDSTNNAKIICIRISQEYFRHIPKENIFKECFKKARSILVEELLRFREHGYTIAGSGSCKACEVCAAEEGILDKCKKPGKQIYSLESLGADVTALTKTCFDFNLEWTTNDSTANFVCAVGAVFFNDKEIE